MIEHAGTLPFYSPTKYNSKTADFGNKTDFSVGQNDSCTFVSEVKKVGKFTY